MSAEAYTTWLIFGLPYPIVIFVLTSAIGNTRVRRFLRISGLAIYYLPLFNVHVIFLPYPAFYVILEGLWEFRQSGELSRTTIACILYLVATITILNMYWTQCDRKDRQQTEFSNDSQPPDV